jgi:hypothetical protein
MSSNIFYTILKILSLISRTMFPILISSGSSKLYSTLSISQSTSILSIRQIGKVKIVTRVNIVSPESTRYAMIAPKYAQTKKPV